MTKSNHRNLSETLELLNGIGFKMEPVPRDVIKCVQGRGRDFVSARALWAFCRHSLTNYDALCEQLGLKTKKDVLPLKRAVNVVIGDALTRHQSPNVRNLARLHGYRP